jgi:hypothetical protein
MATAGPNSPTTAATSGSPAWTASSGALADTVDASDNIRALCGIAASGVSGTLTITGFGFSVPAGTVDGIAVAIERRSTTNNVIDDNSIRLTKASSAVGDNKATATKWPLNTDAVENYGGAADLWGTTWSVAEVNDAGFGIAIVADNTDAGATRSAQVDHVTITITYTAGGATNVAIFSHHLRQQGIS